MNGVILVLPLYIFLAWTGTDLPSPPSSHIPWLAFKLSLSCLVRPDEQTGVDFNRQFAGSRTPVMEVSLGSNSGPVAAFLAVTGS